MVGIVLWEFFKDSNLLSAICDANRYLWISACIFACINAICRIGFKHLCSQIYLKFYMYLINIPSFLFKDLFNCVKVRVRERMRKSENFHPLVYFSNGHDGWDWVKPGAKSFFQISYV